MRLTYYGHSCFSVTVAGRVLLFDPFITGNELARERVDVDALSADYLFVTHGHMDHVGDTVRIAQRTKAMVIASYEVSDWLGGQGVPETRRLGLNTGGGVDLDFGRVKLVVAHHSSRMPDGSYGGNPVGFVVDTAEGAFYAAGDTALTLDMRLIAGSTNSPLVLAALPVGDVFTMGVDDAIRAAEFVDCNRVLGLHYDTFPPIKIDHARAQAKFQAASKDLLLLGIGEEIDLSA